MREPSFWWRPAGLEAQMLAPLAALYSLIATRRMTRRGRRAGVPVVCVGNLTVGGSGKTPTAIAVAKMLREAGRRPFFLTRGYGGRLAGPTRVTPEQRAEEVGDEPLLLARNGPTILAHDRVAGAAAASGEGADVIVMDDGLQNPALAKDLALVVLDGRRGIGNGGVLPAGPLRAALDVQLDCSRAMLVLGAPSHAAKPAIAAARARGLPLLRGWLEPDRPAIEALRSRKILAFAGIADPEKFFATLSAAGIPAELTFAFPDHHPYSPKEAATLVSRAERQGLQLVTTEKDFARLQGDPALAQLAGAAKTLPVTVSFEDGKAMRRLVLDACAT
jgi:tetraacyldisaccharide 4'-kinase